MPANNGRFSLFGTIYCSMQMFSVQCPPGKIHFMFTNFSYETVRELTILFSAFGDMIHGQLKTAEKSLKILYNKINIMTVLLKSKREETR